MLQLLALLIALIVGYLIPRLPLAMTWLNRGVFAIVILILGLMGYEFGSGADNLWLKLLMVGKHSLLFASLLFVFNLGISAIGLRYLNRQLRSLTSKPAAATNYLQFILDSGKYLLIIAMGLTGGAWLRSPISFLNEMLAGLLFLLLFIIGHQLRLAGIGLKQIVLDRNGLRLAGYMLVSSMLAGVCGAFILGMPLKHGLMLCSGYGWYTLASILNSQFVDHDFGTTAFFIDVSRELCALILLPSLGRLFPASMVGYCGATAMDFCLPVIKQNLHERCVTLAIASGMLLSLAVPLLIPIFARF